VNLYDRLPRTSFRPDGISILDRFHRLQLPDWSGWLPRVHPRMHGTGLCTSEFALLYVASRPRRAKSKVAGSRGCERCWRQPRLRITHSPRRWPFSQWSQARHLLGRFVKPKTLWSPELTNRFNSASSGSSSRRGNDAGVWLEARGRDLFGSTLIPVPGATPFRLRLLRPQPKSRTG